MKAWPLYLVFGAILAGSLAVRGRGDILYGHQNLEPAVIRVAAAHDLTFLGTTTLPSTNVGALEFSAPRCPRPVLVVVMGDIIDIEPVLLRAARERHDELHYFYIRRRWDQPARAAIFRERIKIAALATFGLTRYLPSQNILLVERPAECHAAGAVDWRNVWNRDYLDEGPAAAAVK